VTGKLPAFQWYPKDWQADAIFGCSLAARGLWLEMLHVMHGCEPYGYLVENGRPMTDERIARKCGTTPQEYSALLAELDAAGIPRRTNSGIIFSKRLVEDQKRRKEWRQRQQKHREKLATNGDQDPEISTGNSSGRNPDDFSEGSEEKRDNIDRHYDANRKKLERDRSKTSHGDVTHHVTRSSHPSPSPSPNLNTRPPYPPLAGGSPSHSPPGKKEYFSWRGTVIEIEMQNRKRALSQAEWSSLSGSRTEDVLTKIRSRGFRARIVPADEVASWQLKAEAASP